MLSNLILISSCSTYNSVVPSWMEIGSSFEPVEINNDNEEKEKELIRKKAELNKLESEIDILEEETSDWSWWNPFSWF